MFASPPQVIIHFIVIVTVLWQNNLSLSLNIVSVQVCPISVFHISREFF